MKNTIKIVLLAFAVLFLAACQKNSLNNLIGGQKDEYGCLLSGGFSWNETIGACVKHFELDESQAKAAQIVVAPLSYRPITILKVESLRCPGCFIVTLQPGDNPPYEVKLINWKFSNEITSFEECVAAGNPIMESNPSQCSAEGKIFTKNEDEIKYICTKEEKSAEICTLEYMPVCGNNNVTYGNKCSACASKEIEYYTNGECQSIKKCDSCQLLS